MKRALDRRTFLAGTGGALLALPFLRSLAPARARAQTVTAPKRLVILSSFGGRVMGNGAGGGDWWSPGASSGPLPTGGAPLSPLLAPLSDVRDEIVTIDGIDNVLRLASNDDTGHTPALATCMTCTFDASAPSIDFVAGQRLRASPSMRPSIGFRLSADPKNAETPDERFRGEFGSAPYFVSGNPRQALAEVFAGFTPPTSGPPPPPTLRDRMVSSRRGILDAVRGELAGVRARVDARDRQRLEQHEAFIQSIEGRLGGTTTMHGASCMMPDATTLPTVPRAFVDTGWEDWDRGGHDPDTIPFQIETLVQTLACDITRVAVANFNEDPSFLWAFPSANPFVEDDKYHQTIHNAPDVVESATDASNLLRGALVYSRMFTLLIQRLAAVEDVDGNRLLDNTLVLWTSEHGYGSTHAVFNIPVVLAGLGGAFRKGRHIVETNRTTGDLYAHMLRLLGGSDTTYGLTGVMGDHGTRGDYDTNLARGGRALASTPLHGGPLDL